jgi:hypothetical protein
VEQAPVDYKLTISLVVAYGFILLYAYQISFFWLIGFKYAGLSSTFDLGTVLASAAIYVIPIALIFLLLLISFQLSNQAGFNLVLWIADHETLLQVAVTFVLNLPLILLAILKKNPQPFFVSVIITFVVLAAIVYCNIVSYYRIPVWSAVIAAIYPIILASAFGSYAAYYARVLEPRRFDIILENDRLNFVRLIRTTSTGIIYSEDDGRRISFVNMAKVVRVVSSGD